MYSFIFGIITENQLDVPVEDADDSSLQDIVELIIDDSPQAIPSDGTGIPFEKLWNLFMTRLVKNNISTPNTSVKREEMDKTQPPKLDSPYNEEVNEMCFFAWAYNIYPIYCCEMIKFIFVESQTLRRTFAS